MQCCLKVLCSNKLEIEILTSWGCEEVKTHKSREALNIPPPWRGVRISTKECWEETHMQSILYTHTNILLVSNIFVLTSKHTPKPMYTFMATVTIVAISM